MRWSNQKMFAEFEKHSVEVFSLSAAPGEWNVGRILAHFLESADWYRYCLTGIKWEEMKVITDQTLLKSAAARLSTLDDLLIAQSETSDDAVQFHDGEKEATAQKSLILGQAISHAAEHKGQLATILKTNGLNLDLDKLDLWSFATEN